MDRDVLMHQMEERFREEFAKALDALETLPMDIGSMPARWHSAMRL